MKWNVVVVVMEDLRYLERAHCISRQVSHASSKLYLSDQHSWLINNNVRFDHAKHAINSTSFDQYLRKSGTPTKTHCDVFGVLNRTSTLTRRVYSGSS